MNTKIVVFIYLSTGSLSFDMCFQLPSFLVKSDNVHFATCTHDVRRPSKMCQRIHEFTTERGFAAHAPVSKLS